MQHGTDWIPVSRCLPLRGVVVLAMGIHGGVFRAKLDANGEWVNATRKTKKCNVRKWMPLQRQPEEHTKNNVESLRKRAVAQKRSEERKRQRMQSDPEYSNHVKAVRHDYYVGVVKERMKDPEYHEKINAYKREWYGRAKERELADLFDKYR